MRLHVIPCHGITAKRTGSVVAGMWQHVTTVVKLPFQFFIFKGREEFEKLLG